VKLNPLFLLLVVALAAAPTFAGPAVVGVATAIGSFSVNDTSVSGTANLTDGALLKTTSTTGQVTLKGGSRAVLGTNSAAAFYDGKVVLVQGIARFDNLKPGFKAVASSLRVENDQVGGPGAVRLNGDKVEVASVIGNMNVYNHQGALLTRVAAGSVVGVDDSPSGAGGQTPSGASTSAAPIMSNSAALWIAAGLAAVGLGVGLGLTQGSSSSSP
jgi:hypothetical protein